MKEILAVAVAEVAAVAEVVVEAKAVLEVEAEVSVSAKQEAETEVQKLSLKYMICTQVSGKVL